MFKDRKEELKRLEEELLEEEDLQEEAEEYEYEDEYEDEPDCEDEDATVMFTPVTQHYRARNTDRTDVDLESYSREVEEGPSSNRGLAVLLLLLCMGVAAVLLYLVLRLRGYL